jgi:hypothetical protein
VEKKAKETGESAADMRKKIKCHNYGKAGHISTDCKKTENSGKFQKGNKSKNKGEKPAKSVMQLTTMTKAS